MSKVDTKLMTWVLPEYFIISETKLNEKLSNSQFFMGSSEMV